MTGHDNIFRLGARAASEKVGPEDLFTAHLAWMLRLDPELRRHWCALLTGMPLSACGEAEVALWPYVGPDVPDMVLDLGGNGRLICEHKLDSGFGPNQLSRYLELATEETSRTGLQHRVAAITKNPIRIAPECAAHPRYLQTDDSRHFRWEQLYSLVRKLPRPPHSHLAVLRNQFLEYMRELSLDPCPLVPGFDLLFAQDNVEGRVAQRKGFARLWAPTRKFFEERGFSLMAGCIMQLYAGATERSDIHTGSGMSHILMQPSSIRPRSLRDDLPLPFVEVRAVVLPHKQPVLDRLASLSYPLMFDDIPVSCGDLPVQKKYRHHVFVFPLTSAVGEHEIRSDAAQRLAMVVTGLYGHVQEAFRAVGNRF